jgi:SAM-dependent methyltransferase
MAQSVQQRKGDATYVLGSSERERQRLLEQARYFEASTRQLLLDAGLREGMRVLDVGCGVGSVTQLAASIVGTSGLVIGVDRDPNAVAAARQHAEEVGVTGVAFVEADFRTLVHETPFDAIIGRFVLMYQGDAAAALRSAVRWLRPGGIVAFQEPDYSTGFRCYPPSKLFDRVIGYFHETLRRAGVDMNIGLKLRAIFAAAGLTDPDLRINSFVGAKDFNAFRVVAESVRSVLPYMEQFGIATAEEVGIDTFAERLWAEFGATHGVGITPPLVDAWAKLPKCSERIASNTINGDVSER